MNKWMLVFTIIMTPFAAQAKEMCTLAQTVLSPAKKNRCFDQLVSLTKNAEDRKWLLSIQNSWNPPKNLQLILKGAGFRLSQGKKQIGEFQWLTLNPPIFSMNGKMYVSKRKFYGSLSNTIASMMKSTSKSAQLFSHLVPQAEAEDADSELIEKTATIFSIGYSYNRGKGEVCTADCGTAKELMDRYSSLNYLSSTWQGSRSIQCSTVGAQKVPLILYDYEADSEDDVARNVIVSQTDKNEVEIEGVLKNSNKKVYVSLLPNQNTMCTYAASQELDEKYCDSAWEDFFKKEPQLEQEFRKSDFAYFECNAFEREGKKKCFDYFTKRFVKYDYDSHMQTKVCVDESCSAKVPVNEINYVEYKKYLKELNLTTECSVNGCTLPEQVKMLPDLKQRRKAMVLQQETIKSGEQSSISLYLDYSAPFLKYLSQTALLLSECCKDKECRDSALTNKDLKFEDESQQSVSK